SNFHPIHPRFIPDSSQIHPRFIPDSSQIHPRFIPDSSQIHSSFHPCFIPRRVTNYNLYCNNLQQLTLWYIVTTCVGNNLQISNLTNQIIYFFDNQETIQFHSSLIPVSFQSHSSFIPISSQNHTSFIPI